MGVQFKCDPLCLSQPAKPQATPQGKPDQTCDDEMLLLAAEMDQIEKGLENVRQVEVPTKTTNQGRIPNQSMAATMAKSNTIDGQITNQSWAATMAQSSTFDGQIPNQSRGIAIDGRIPNQSRDGTAAKSANPQQISESEGEAPTNTSFVSPPPPPPAKKMSELMKRSKTKGPSGISKSILVIRK